MRNLRPCIVWRCRYLTPAAPPRGRPAPRPDAARPRRIQRLGAVGFQRFEEVAQPVEQRIDAAELGGIGDDRRHRIVHRFVGRARMGGENVDDARLRHVGVEAAQRALAHHHAAVERDRAEQLFELPRRRAARGRRIAHSGRSLPCWGSDTGAGRRPSRARARRRPPRNRDRPA